jgi:hypothetical protein
LPANGSDFAPVDSAAGYIRDEKYSNYGMERFCNKRVFRDFSSAGRFCSPLLDPCEFDLDFKGSQSAHGRINLSRTQTSFSSCHNPLPLREAAEAEVGCAALHCKALSTPEAAALLSLNRVDHHRKLGSASGATIGFSDADKKLSKLSPTCVAPAVAVNSVSFAGITIRPRVLWNSAQKRNCSG